ncbi:hypothetical protein DV532_29090 (plasmid) [Pseudomonas sp. Leaf58]|nr:hypothetical protein DV532_29090 [Pseudomonas sp. Leaf58]KQN62152.1 hypothetical protein ASF02_08195 [Pseudomonas sp. Leaf58]
MRPFIPSCPVAKLVGLHRLSPLKKRVLTHLVGSPERAETLIANAVSIERLREHLFQIHGEWRALAPSEKELAYRLLRVGQSLGFRYANFDVSFTLLFKREHGADIGDVSVDLSQYPSQTEITSFRRGGGHVSNTVRVERGGSVVARFVEACESLFG